jgi:predicted secreted acid phosphatase
MGDVAPGSERIPRRAAIAGRFCVIALAGDQLGDFTDLFNARSLPVAARRAAATSGPLAALWGNGWFVLSNPVYGSGLRGGFDDVFPADKRWSDPAGEDQQ